MPSLHGYSKWRIRLILNAMENIMPKSWIFVIIWLFKQQVLKSKYIGSMSVWEKYTELSQNHKTHRMVEVGRDLLRLSCPTLLLKIGHLEQAAHDPVWIAFEYLQGGRFYKLPGQPLSVLVILIVKKWFIVTRQNFVFGYLLFVLFCFAF